MPDAPYELKVDEVKSFAELALEEESAAIPANVRRRSTSTAAADEVTVTSASMEDLLREELAQIVLNGQTFWIAEGDLRLDAAQLRFYAEQQQAIVTAWQQKVGHYDPGFEVLPIVGRVAMDASPTGLLGMVQNGRIVRWREGLVLKYCILKNTFTTGNSQQNYEQVVADMHQATAAWEQTCGVRFAHVAELDSHQSTDPSHADFRTQGIMFLVQELDLPGSTVAMAFFPNEPKNRRSVYIDPVYYDPGASFEPVGVLRHELGHVLGFRHEHIRSGAPAQCRGESLFGTIPLTAYDPQSVMHYFCGENRGLLQITDLDRIGAQKVYGPPFPPLDGFLFVGLD